MEAPVARVAVLGRTVGAQGEAAHGGADAVVRQVLDDAGPRPAVGAGEEGVAVAAVARVEELAQAGVAEGGVGAISRGDGSPGLRDGCCVR
ncbi:hypothetical protein SSPIM334S_07212 [Streptomyces spiroverticillatus]